jgi:hypothetical protein
MPTTSTETFTVGVFKDAVWAARGIDALVRQGFPLDSLSIIARESDEVAALTRRMTARVEVLDLQGVGRALCIGPLVAALQRDEQQFAQKGLAASMHLAGFQAHDGRIFQTLTERGGVLVAVRSEPRAADALATLHAYGGGNAAIGAWHGRL